MESGIDGMRRTLQEREPQRPSALVTTLQGSALTEVARSRHAEPVKLISQLRGDLDWIVIRALEKDRARRYETANGLAMDVRRFLDNEPIVARPPSRTYRLQKLVRRNKVTFIAGAMVGLALISGLGLSTWFWYQERDARKRAVAAEQQAMAAEQQQARLRRQSEDRERITQAAFLVSQKKVEEADKLMGKVSEIKPSLDAESVLRAVGESYALKGQWSEAAERFRLLLEVDQRDNSWAITEDLLKAGPIQIERNDLQGYERFRLAAIARFKNTTDPILAERTIKISLLLPADDEILKSLVPLSEISAKSLENTGKDAIMEAWRCVSLALMAYRQDYTPTAKAWSQKCLSYSENNPSRIATAHIIQAMSCYKLNESDEAVSELEWGRKMVNDEFAKGIQEGNGSEGFWFDWLFARILLREAEASIGKTASLEN
jgi:tetratricopeptide (TPR) repeat protein